MKKICSKCKKKIPLKGFNFNKRDKKYFYSCKKCSKEMFKIVRKQVGSYAYWYRKYCRIRNNAKIRNIDFNLNLKEFKSIYLDNKVCIYCKLREDIMSVDRVNNSKGYFKDNCVLACLDCNRSKGKFELKDVKWLKNLCKIIKQKHIK